MKNFFIASFVALTLSAGSATLALAQNENNDATTSKLTAHLKERGFTKCMERIDKITNFVINSGLHSAVVYFDEKKNDENIVSFLMGREGNDANYLASLDFTQNDSCSATYEITRIWVDACPDVLEAAYEEYQNPRPLHGGFTVLSKSDGLHLAVRALPGDSGCLTVQKEIIF